MRVPLLRCVGRHDLVRLQLAATLQWDAAHGACTYIYTMFPPLKTTTFVNTRQRSKQYRLRALLPIYFIIIMLTFARSVDDVTSHHHLIYYLIPTGPCLHDQRLPCKVPQGIRTRRDPPNGSCCVPALSCSTSSSGVNVEGWKHCWWTCKHMFSCLTSDLCPQERKCNFNHALFFFTICNSMLSRPRTHSHAP